MHGGQKKVLDSLELQVVISFHVGTEFKSSASVESVLNH